MVVRLPECSEPLVLESTTLGESVDIRLKPVAGVTGIPFQQVGGLSRIRCCATSWA